MPVWMTKLLQKDKEKGKQQVIIDLIRASFWFGNYWKKQKEFRRKSRGTNDLLFIDEMIKREVEMRKQNLSLAWIDCKRSYDIVPYSWIIDWK